MKYLSIILSLIIFIFCILNLQVYFLLFLLVLWVPVFLFYSYLRKNKLIFYINTILWGVSIFFLVIFFRLFFFEVLLVPTASMKNAIIPGERIWVTKTGFPLNNKIKKGEIPWINILLSKEEKKEEINLRNNLFLNKNISINRNDILVFKQKYSKTRYVKRCVGVPGDTLKINNSNLMINNKIIVNNINFIIKIKYFNRAEIDSFINTLTKKDKIIVHNPTMRELVLSLGNVKELYNIKFDNLKQIKPKFPDILDIKDKYIIIPEKKYFILGDNVSNSSDSREWGFLPEENIRGKAKAILFSSRFSEFIKELK